MNHHAKFLTSGTLLARSFAWNLVGMAAPVLVALFSIPALIEGMGQERFGILAIVWVGVGYFSLFDLGVGRALTKLVADRLGRNQFDDMRALIWTSISLLVVLGIAASVLLFVLAPALIGQVLRIAPELQSEATTAMQLLASGLPLVIVTSALVGLLQAHQRFATITVIRIPLGILTFAGPLMTLQISPSLVWATAILVVGRAIALIAYFFTAAQVRPELQVPTMPDRTQLDLVFRFGGWLTVTNVIGPLMTYLDRFFVGASQGMVAVTHYATPYEVLARGQMLPRSFMAVLFPALSTAAGSDWRRFYRLYAVSSRALPLVMLPFTAACFLLAPEALLLWLGEDFRQAATPVVRFLAAGWMVNVISQLPFTALQSVGRPDLVAKTHLVEVIPYLVALWWATGVFGIAGTAAVWTFRVIADAIALNEVIGKLVPELSREVAATRVRIGISIVGFSGAALLELLMMRVTVLVILCLVSGILLWPIVMWLRASVTESRGKSSPVDTLMDL